MTAAVISQLRRRGFSLQRVRKVIAFLSHEFGTSLAATVRAASEYHLLTDGTNLYLRTSARQVVDLLKNSDQPMFDICLSDEVRRVRGEMQRAILHQSPMDRETKEMPVSNRRQARSRKAGSQKTGTQKHNSQKKDAASDPVQLLRRARRA